MYARVSMLEQELGRFDARLDRLYDPVQANRIDERSFCRSKCIKSRFKYVDGPRAFHGYLVE